MGVTHDSLQFVMECLNTIELLTTLPSKTQHKEEMFEMYILMLINLLQESHTQDASKSYLHENCIQRLNKTAPTQLNVFTNIMKTNPECKSKLDKAIRESRAKSQQKSEQLDKNKLTIKSVKAAPKIQLKMDFSNFGKK